MQSDIGNDKPPAGRQARGDRAIIANARVERQNHHSEYLAKAIDALTPEGRKRVDVLLDQLTEVVGDHEAVARFAAARKVEAERGRLEASAGASPGRVLSTQELTLRSPASGKSVIRSRWTTSRTGRMLSWRCSKTKPAAVPRTDAAFAPSTAAFTTRSPRVRLARALPRE